MENDDQEEINCADVDEKRVICNICDKLVIDRYYNNHFQSGTQIINSH